MTPETSVQLLTALERSGPQPALAWYGEASRIELSGHVLANWVIKAIGHLHDEIALEPGDAVVLDLPAHWKRLVLALAAWSLGAEVSVLDRGRDGADGMDGSDGAQGASQPVPPSPRVVATDHPDSPLAADADEVLALQPVSLAPRFDGELPPLAHDWVEEVRAHPDRLGVPLPAWSGPAATDVVAPPEPAEPSEPSGSARPRLLTDDDGLVVLPTVLAALLAGGGIVAPASAVDERQAADESVTGRA